MCEHWREKFLAFSRRNSVIKGLEAREYNVPKDQQTSWLSRVCRERGAVSGQRMKSAVTWHAAYKLKKDLSISSDWGRSYKILTQLFTSSG